MMKLVLLLWFVLAARGINAFVAGRTDILSLTGQMSVYVSECIVENAEETQTNIDSIQGLLTGNAHKDKLMMEKVTRCFFHKAGILEPDGKLNIDAAMTILTLVGVKRDDAEELLQKCTSITGFDARDTAYAVIKCFNKAVKA